MSAEPQKPKRLAAVVFENGDAANAIVTDFALALGASGTRLGGFVQISEDTENCGCKDTYVLDLQTGERTKILQDLGSGSQGCRVDPAALAGIGQLVSNALSHRPELVIINRFGRLESEGKGLRDEIATAALSGIPTLVCVSTRYLDAWREFATDLGDVLTCTPHALAAWWQSVVVELASSESCHCEEP
jgi:nucleoside-triphosphatase THEP1